MASFADFMWVLQMEKSMMLFILMFVVLVAAFMVTSLLLVLVLKKTREIGLLGALGAKRSQIAWCFCAQGMFIGICGVLSGLALGYTLLHFRNEAVMLLSRLAGNENIFAQFYQLTRLPAYTETSDLVVIIAGSLILSTLAGVLPAIIAARLKPVEALRSE
jgi:lipoprotein-releasing system permease protein